MKRNDSKHARTTQDRTVLASEDLAITSGGGAGCCPPIRPVAVRLCIPPPIC